MMDFDPDHPEVGKISGNPPFIPDGCDRPARYEFRGKLYDQHGQVIEPGKPADAMVANENGPDAEALMPVTELLAQADTLPWGKFLKQAKMILGAQCPAGKPAIITALQEALAGYQARQAKRSSSSSAGLTWNGLKGEAPPQPTPAPQPAPVAAAKPATGIDLAAWARGQKEYLWGEVQKTIRKEHHRHVTERRDAVEFLIEIGVISAGEARQDVRRDPVRMASDREDA